MTAITVIKGNDGRLQGVDEKSQRAYQKFKRMVADLDYGQTISFSYRFPRSPKHHRLLFAKLQSLLHRTEAFTDVDHLRHWLLMGAGFCDFIPGLDGKPNAIPKSMNFDNMDEAEFSELHRAADAFLWTSKAQEVLWPALDEEARYRCMESFMGEFE
jgi:hypothetical protein